MPFSRDSLTVLLNRSFANYQSLFKPLDKTPRYNLLKVFSAVDAGMYHQLLGDLTFLADQIFPDTAAGDYLRLHWSDRVPPLNAAAAVGIVLLTGVPSAAVPAGLVFSSPSGQRYFTDKAYHIGADGTTVILVQAESFGAQSNQPAGTELTLMSSIPPGIDSKALADAGITGGSDGETDEAYLIRVLQTLRNNVRYGKPGDFADWAIDSSPEVTKAWEYKNFGVFGALLIQVAGGNQIDGISQVKNLQLVADYISTVAPPVLFTVRTPELIQLNPVLSLPKNDTVANREMVLSRIKSYLQSTSKPGKQFTSGMLRNAFVDGVNIISGIVKLNGDTNGIVSTTILQLPVLGVPTWE